MAGVVENEIAGIEDALYRVLANRDGLDGAELNEVIALEEQSPSGLRLGLRDRVDRQFHFEMNPGDDSGDAHPAHHSQNANPGIDGYPSRRIEGGDQRKQNKSEAEAGGDRVIDDQRSGGWTEDDEFRLVHNVSLLKIRRPGGSFAGSILYGRGNCWDRLRARILRRDPNDLYPARNGEADDRCNDSPLALPDSEVISFPQALPLVVITQLKA